MKLNPPLGSHIKRIYTARTLGLHTFLAMDKFLKSKAMFNLHRFGFGDFIHKEKRITLFYSYYFFRERLKVGTSGQDFLSQVVICSNLVVQKHLKILLEQPSQLRQRLLVSPLVRPLHMKFKSCHSISSLDIGAHAVT